MDIHHHRVHSGFPSVNRYRIFSVTNRGQKLNDILAALHFTSVQEHDAGFINIFAFKIILQDVVNIRLFFWHDTCGNQSLV